MKNELAIKKLSKKVNEMIKSTETIDKRNNAIADEVYLFIYLFVKFEFLN